MRVLMFGWEYPPYATGGLATATIALARGLARAGADVVLVVPFPGDAGAVEGVRVVSASDHVGGLRLVRVASPLVPYPGAADAGLTVFGAAGRRTPIETSPYRS